jgi:hypothetical protein
LFKKRIKALLSVIDKRKGGKCVRRLLNNVITLAPLALLFSNLKKKNTHTQVVLFVLATDTPTQISAIKQALMQSPPCAALPTGGQRGQEQPLVRCAFASNEGVGEVGHISNKGTMGHLEVAQRNWADWFILSEVVGMVGVVVEGYMYMLFLRHQGGSKRCRQTGLMRICSSITTLQTH